MRLAGEGTKGLVLGGIAWTWLVISVVWGLEPPELSTGPPTRNVVYYETSLSGGMSELRERFTPAQLRVLEKLNRCDLTHLVQQKTAIVPKTWFQNELRYSPLPVRYAWAAPYPKVLIIYQPAQVFGGYEHGQLIRWGPVSTGRKGAPTPSGLFHLNWKSTGRRSTVDPNWFMPWYFNFHNRLGLSLHEYNLPGYPASHACVRLLKRDAQWLYYWGEGWELDKKGWNVLKYGTPVLILGAYDFDAPPPWRSFQWLSHGIELPAQPLGG